jgi:UDP-N-acetylmuramoylalanine--D-glutamate ligase
MKKSPDIAVVTNVAPNHLDVHIDMNEYIAAKKNIFLYQSADKITVLNADNEITSSFEAQCPGKVRLFSRKKPVNNGYFYEDGHIYSANNGSKQKIMNISDIKIPGIHNIENYMAAFAATQDFVKPETMKKVAADFKGIEHRIELVRELRGVKYYNDSIASSPSRTAAGLNSFDRKVILIAGGKDKGVPFDELGALICERVKTLVLTGLTAEKIKSAVESSPNYDGKLPVFIVEDFKDAILKASEEAREGDIVILSPACTSFDRFRSFTERGNLFKDIINGLV